MEKEPKTIKKKIQKKVWLISVIVLVVAMVAFFRQAYFIEPKQLAVNKYTMQVPQQVAPMRVVFFSDTHFGRYYPQENLQRIVNEINAQKADIVVFAGDFYDYYKKDKDNKKANINIPAASAQLANIQATIGKYAIFGNHDYYSGMTYLYKGLMQNGNFTVLRNERVFLPKQNITLFGYDDALRGRIYTKNYTIENDGYTLVLLHEPTYIDKIKTKQESLMLSGHTHGGQVDVPGLTKLLMKIKGEKYIKGNFYNLGKNQNMNLVVSSGIGMTRLPLRFGNTPEIVVIDLVHAE